MSDQEKTSTYWVWCSECCPKFVSVVVFQHVIMLTSDSPQSMMSLVFSLNKLTCKLTCFRKNKKNLWYNYIDDSVFPWLFCNFFLLIWSLIEFMTCIIEYSFIFVTHNRQISCTKVTWGFTNLVADIT